MMRWCALALLIGGAACRRNETPAPRRDPVSAAGPTDAERAACAVIAKTHADAVARLRSDSGAELAPLLAQLPKLFGRCLPATRGAYGFVLDELCGEHTKFDDGHADADVLGRWRFVHVDGAGRSVSYPISRGGIGACGGRIDHRDSMTIVGSKQAPNEWLVATEPLLFDYDGDGEKEVLVDLTGSVVQDAPETGDLSLYTTSEVRLLTFRDGAIVPLPSTTSLFLDGTARDIDHDGRPDLRVYRPLSTASDRPWAEVPVDFFAHSLPSGAFSLDDGVALGAARASCGKVPASLIARQPSGALDADRTIGNVACARLSGMSVEALTAKLSADCAKEPACESLAAHCVKAARSL